MKKAVIAWLSGPVGWGRQVLVLIAAAGGVAVLVAGIDHASVAWQHEHFQKIPCDIETCNIVRESGRDDRNLPGWQYVFSVTYHYEVNGETFTSQVVSSRTKIIASQTAAEQFQQRFSPGARAECYVNPQDPTDAMLELPDNSQAIRVARFGGLAVALAFVALVVLQVMLTIDTAPRRLEIRAPGWGEIDSDSNDALHRTRLLLREKLENKG